MSSFETKATIRSFGGKIFKLTHQSPTTTTPMNLNLYLPPAALTTPPTRVPVLMYLSGLTGTYYHDVYSRPLFLLQSMSRAQFLNSPLPQWNNAPYHKNYILTLTSSTSQTPPLPPPSPPPNHLPPQPLPTLPPTNPPPPQCTPDNCTEKGFFQRPASHLGLAILYPDTSPRGLSIPGANDSYDFGEAASFYLDATIPPYSTAYNMETYLTSELPSLLFSDAEFGPYLDSSRVSITGHSMGGHGALTLYLRHPGMYKSCSAFAPIVNPTGCAWGKKAFTGYLGEENKEAWKGHDATELIRKVERGEELKVLVDQGTGDQFYKEGQLRTEELERAVEGQGVEGVQVRYQEGYDHSYFFMATFAEEHVEFAARALGVL